MSQNKRTHVSILDRHVSELAPPCFGIGAAMFQYNKNERMAVRFPSLATGQTCVSYDFCSSADLSLEMCLRQCLTHKPNIVSVCCCLLLFFIIRWDVCFQFNNIFETQKFSRFSKEKMLLVRTFERSKNIQSVSFFGGGLFADCVITSQNFTALCRALSGRLWKEATGGNKSL